jgi:hypothetical protein
MKRTSGLCLLLLVAVLLFGCAQSQALEEGETGSVTLNATVLEVYDSGGLLAQCTSSGTGLAVGAHFTVEAQLTTGEALPSLKRGDRIQVVFDGGIAETEPAQLLTVYQVRLLENGGEG